MKLSRTLLRDLLEMFALALGLYLLVTFAIQAVHVVGSSMNPSLQDAENQIEGKAVVRFWPFNHLQVLNTKPTLATQ